MALIFVRLYEAARRRPIDSKQLNHVTLIEEAHRLLRNMPQSSGTAESANPRGKAVEMFTDMMAEMRARGEGFMIVDQMPSKLVADVIKGSDLKIVHRLLAHDDRQTVGNAMGLSPEQINFLPRLKVGQAVIHSEQLEEACLVKIDPKEDQLISQHEGATPHEKDNAIKQKGTISDETILKHLPWVDDPKEELGKINAQKKENADVFLRSAIDVNQGQ